MLDESQILNLLGKMKRFETTLEPLIFETVDEICDVSLMETKDVLYEIPREGYRPIAKGEAWGGEEVDGFFRMSYTVPDALAGTPLFLKPHTQGYESLLWVDGKPFGTYATKIVVTTHGNHYCDLIRMDPKAGEKIELCVEVYCGHYVRGTQPFEYDGRRDFTAVYSGMEICVKNRLVSDFFFDLKTVNEMIEGMEKTSYRRADLINTLEKIHRIIYYDPDNIDRATFENALSDADELLKEQLQKPNGPTAPFAGFIGHSHMDTAWLWHRDETIKKCARTYSNQLALMEQYPEHRFMQSSAFHGEMLLEHYPELFERIRQKVKEGRYEPNGGVYVECDCNITGGESMIRQFLWGQRFTREHFGYTSDTFWLPDTFGYSAAIPQIMKGCEVQYFVTTKMSWNDTTDFPYDSFLWEGLDGTRVLSHFPKTHDFPSPTALIQFLYARDRHGDVVKDKRLSRMKMLGYGFGDGGGGPQFEQIEMGKRLRDVEGMPRSEFLSVSEFMKRLKTSMPEPPVYSGELYLEYHRGTLTNQHQIKRNNRKAEIALHDLEMMTVQKAVRAGIPADGKDIRPLTRLLLINQFHDILPGTGLPRVNQECRRDISHVIETANAMIGELLCASEKEEKTVSVTNTLSFPREDTLYISAPRGYAVSEAAACQRITDVEGREWLALSGIRLQAMETRVLHLVPENREVASAFLLDGDSLETPFASVRFDENGGIASLIDKRMNRQLRGDGYPLNTFLLAEDVSLKWDNWDIDADLMPKMKPDARLLSRRVVCDGVIELRIESEYRLTPKSTLVQQMIFSAVTPEIRFETVIHWQDDHRFLKVAFDTPVFASESREETQFGYALRPTHDNNPQDIAKFEVCCHKYADLSESRWGIALLNDCKYGIQAKQRSLRLSLHKGGCNPDFTGDKGDHKVVYSFLPHDTAFGADSVILPAYRLNYPVRPGHAEAGSLPALFTLRDSNIICEAVKPCEDARRAYILRLYEAEGTSTETCLHFCHPVRDLFITNMLEENRQRLGDGEDVTLTFRPFEIKTLKVEY